MWVVLVALLPSGSWLGLSTGKHQQKTGGRKERGWGMYLLDPSCWSPWAGCWGSEPLSGGPLHMTLSLLGPQVFPSCPSRPRDADGSLHWVLGREASRTFWIAHVIENVSSLNSAHLFLWACIQCPSACDRPGTVRGT